MLKTIALIAALTTATPAAAETAQQRQQRCRTQYLQAVNRAYNHPSASLESIRLAERIFKSAENDCNNAN